VLLKHHEFADRFRAGNWGEKLNARAFDRDAFRTLRRGELDGSLRRVSRRACALQECEHRLEMRIFFAVAELFGGLQPDDFRVCIHQGANFLPTLMLERHQPHEFDRVACVAQASACGRSFDCGFVRRLEFKPDGLKPVLH